MRKVYEGKTKQVFENEKGNLVMQFKDDVTGTGEEIDPGGNEVVGQVSGKGRSSLSLTVHFFELLKQNNIPTHYISADLNRSTMEVKKGQTLGLEIVCRLKAYGSFLRRYPDKVKAMQDLNYLVEFTVKDDERGDPLINEDALQVLGVLAAEEIVKVKRVTRSVGEILENHLTDKGLTLVDFKLEFGRVHGDIVIIDEISGDGMRVFRGSEPLSQKALAEEILTN